MTETKLKLLELSKIQPSTTNPRKEFDENSLKELAESIKQHGVLQPIVVRPVKGEIFEIICGERRYRASKIAEIEFIPATIRNVNDDQAFEMQIIENLERKDVHPLDEAEAFKAMLNSGKYSIIDIAAKVAKNESYIIQRLKLNELVPEIKTDFYSGKLGIGHAIIIAKLPEDDQKDLIENYKNESDYGTVKELKEYLDRNLYDLDEAIFDINDSKIIPESGPCTSCLKCTKANPTLFPDEQENICYDKTCYKNKERKYILQLIEKTIKDQPEMFFLDGSYGNSLNSEILNLLEQYNIKPLKNYDDFYDRTSGKYKGLYISGFNIGKTVNIDLTVTASKKIDPTKTSDEKIKKIEEREERAKELDREKIYKRIIEDIVDSPEYQKNLFSIHDLKLTEKNALIYSLTSWQDTEWLAKELGVTEKKMPGWGIEKYKLIQEKADPNLWLKVIKKYLRRELCKLSILDFEKYGEAAAYYNIANEYFSEYIKLLTDEQNKIAEKRGKRVKERILELKKDVNPLPTKGLQDKEISRQGVFNYPKTFEKVSKKYALKNSYFKNRHQDWPGTPVEVVMYFEQHEELPFNMGEDIENWMYECFIEYQKRNNVYHSQFFTPPKTAEQIAGIAQMYFDTDREVLDACCGFGMLSNPLFNKGYTVKGFDFSSEMVDLYSYNFGKGSAVRLNYKEDDLLEKYFNIISNPPYETPALTEFLIKLYDYLEDGGTAVLLIPKGFIEKEKPKNLVQILSKFNIVYRVDMKDNFAHTKIKAEIVVLDKITE